jgi:hypothetical protein
MVGTIVRASGSVVVHGEGETWEAAFAEASERAEFLKDYKEIV